MSERKKIATDRLGNHRNKESVVFYVLGKPDNVEELAQREIETKTSFKVEDFTKDRSGILLTSLFDVYDVTNFSGVLSCNSNQVPLYNRFCREFNFTISDNLHVWTKNEIPYESELKEATKLNIIKYSFGQLQNVNEFYCVEDVNDDNLFIEFSPSTFITIYHKDKLDDTDECLHYNSVQVSLRSLKNFAFVSYEKYSFTLVLLLNTAPFFHCISKNEYNKLIKKRIFKSEIVRRMCSCNVLSLSFELTAEKNILDVIKSKYMFPVTVLNTKIQFINSKLSLKLDVDRCNKSIRWLLECLYEKRAVQLNQNDVDFLADTMKEESIFSGNAELMLLRMVQQSIPYLQNVQQEIKSRVEALKRNKKAHEISFTDTIPDDLICLKRTIITPTRIIAKSEYYVPGSRFLRFAEKEGLDVVVVSFREEDLSKIEDKSIACSFYNVLSEGFIVNGSEYRYILSSSSQLRNHKGYFIKTSSPGFIKQWRKKFIPRPEVFVSIAKYLARLGMYGTVDKPVFVIRNDSIEWSKDIEAANRVLTTDGAGLISFRKAEEIAKSLELEDVPTAFQIRYSGTKGILVCTQNEDATLNGKEILIRDSMKKFQNEDEIFCITGYSKMNQLLLNREIITLLSCIEGFDIESQLMKYLHHEIDDLLSMFLDQKKGMREINSFLTTGPLKSVSKSNHNLLTDRFWIKMLQGVYRVRTKFLKSKSSLTIKDGCNVMGVPDTRGVLCDNEVFVQIQCDESTKKIIEGDAIIFRNPCLHPGDFRKVRCVNKPELQHLYNVVVLPALNCKESLSLYCSGGDLDGDEYSVIWDKRLIPKHHYKPYDYAAPDGESIFKSANCSSPSQIAQYICKYFGNDLLGKIANMHLALCDQLENGARDRMSIELAIAHSKAVDFPKTGVLPVISRETRSHISGYPDFMEKKSNLCYNSEKVLGKMYRYCKSIFYDDEIFDTMDEPPCTLDYIPQVDLKKVFENVDCFDKYIEEAKAMYHLYKQHMEILMYRFNLRDEVDIIFGMSTYETRSAYDKQKSKLADTLTSSYANIVYKFRKMFFESEQDEENVQAKAYACYYVVYNLVSQPHKAFLSFPWMFGDVLYRTGALQHFLVTSENRFTESVKMLFSSWCEKHIDNIEEKLAVSEEIEHQLSQHVESNLGLSSSCFQMYTYGSVSLYLCELGSDIDVTILAKDELLKKAKTEEENEDEVRQILRTTISPAFNQIASTGSKKEVLHPNIRVPFVTFQTSKEQIKCDVTVNNTNGLLKTYCIHYLYRENPANFLVFLILIQWARRAEIIKMSNTNESHSMDTAEFYGLIMHVMQFKNIPNPEMGNDIEPFDFQKLILSIYKLSDKELKYTQKTILEFFKRLSRMEKSVVVKWPIKGIEDVPLPANTMSMASTCAAKAYHCLLCTNDVLHMLYYFRCTNENVSAFSINLGSSIRMFIGSHIEFANKLSRLCGANVTASFNEKIELILSANCSNYSKSLLKEELNYYKGMRQKLVGGQRPLLTGKYFLENSSFILMPIPDDLPKIHVMKNEGNYHVSHAITNRSRFFLKGVDYSSLNWKQSQKEAFYQRILYQLKEFEFGNKALVSAIEITARFGNYYTINLKRRVIPNDGLMLQKVNSILQSAQKKRNKWRRKDFDSSNLGRKVDKPKTESVTVPSISGSFIPSIMVDPRKSKVDISVVKDVYRKALKKLSFYEGSAFKRPAPVWKAKIQASSSYEFDIHLDKNGKLLYAEERPFNWVHATLIKGKPQRIVNNMLLSNVDARALITTNRYVLPHKNLYKHVLLKDGKETLPILIINGKPVRNEKTEKSRCVSFVRHTKDSENFTNGRVNAAIKSGTAFSLQNVAEEQEFCEFSLYFNPKELQQCVDGKLDEKKLREFANYFFDITVDMQRVLEETINEEGRDRKTSQVRSNAGSFHCTRGFRRNTSPVKRNPSAHYKSGYQAR